MRYVEKKKLSAVMGLIGILAGRLIINLWNILCPSRKLPAAQHAECTFSKQGYRIREKRKKCEFDESTHYELV